MSITTVKKKKLLEQLFEEKKALGQISHKVSCPMEDPESYAPCSCGAGDKAKLIGVLDETINFLLDT